MSKKNILLLIVAVAAVAVFSFIVVSNKTPQQQQNQTNLNQGKEVDISDWQTYRNEEYGFEVKYPEGWFVITDQKSILIQNTKKELVIGGLLPEDMTNKTLEGSCFKIDIFENPLGLSVENWVKTQPNIPKLSYKTIFVNGIEAEFVKPIDGIFYGDPNIFIIDRNYIYNIRFITTNHKQHSSNIDVFNEILETFGLFN